MVLTTISTRVSNPTTRLATHGARGGYLHDAAAARVTPIDIYAGTDVYKQKNARGAFFCFYNQALYFSSFFSDATTCGAE